MRQCAKTIYWRALKKFNKIRFTHKRMGTGMGRNTHRPPGYFEIKIEQEVWLSFDTYTDRLM
jgi:hypothetical protein